MKPIFIFSLPRAGSTLLQRVLASHTDISSSAEPWVLLPYLYARKKTGQFAEYSHFSSEEAINDFVANLPNKDKDYDDAFGEFIINLYKKKCLNNEVYFLDKTPRYYLIIPEIVKLFPDAKFIFLYRNPAHVFSSIISTFGQGRLNKLHGYFIDFVSGPDNLAKGFDLVKNVSYRLQYEEFIKSPSKYIEEIFEYLEIKQQPEVLTQFSKTTLSGNMGDPTGVEKYSSISKKSLDTWSDTIDSKVKKYVLTKILSTIKEDTFDKHGYSKNMVLDEVNKLKANKFGIKDLLDLIGSYLIRILNLNIFFSKDGKWSRGKYLS